MQTIDASIGAVRAFITHYPLVAMFLSGMWAVISVDLMSFARAKEIQADAVWSWRRHFISYLQGGIGNVLGTSVITAGAAGVSAVALLLFW